MRVEKLSALKDCAGAMERLDFFALREPRCPHCGTECEIGRHEWWRPYEEGEHEVTCPFCDNDFTVSTRVSYSFSTDRQEDTP